MQCRELTANGKLHCVTHALWSNMYITVTNISQMQKQHNWKYQQQSIIRKTHARAVHIRSTDFCQSQAHDRSEWTKYTAYRSNLIEQYRIWILILQLCNVPQYVFLCNNSQQTAANTAKQRPVHYTFHTNTLSSKNVSDSAVPYLYQPLSPAK